MATRIALVMINGTTTQIAAADTLAVGAGVTTTAGSLTVSSAGGTTVLADAAVTVQGTPTFQAGALASGAVAFDLSGSTGGFKTPTGAVTVGPGTVTVSGATTFTAAGTALTVNNNATVTGTLTAGSILAAGLTDTGLTTTAMTGGVGQSGYLSGASTLTPTDNAAIAKSRVFGVYTGTSGQMQIAGVVAAALFTTAGGSPTIGAPVFLAAAADDGATGAGKLTATAPVTGGSVVAEVGLCVDNTNYAGGKTAKVLIQPKAPVQL